LVLNVIEEVLDKTQNVIFRRRIENQLLPYTLSYVRNTFLGVAEVDYELFRIDRWMHAEDLWTVSLYAT
jgi:hypothetical protein